jgi:hypothetical protein
MPKNHAYNNEGNPREDQVKRLYEQRLAMFAELLVTSLWPPQSPLAGRRGTLRGWEFNASRGKSCLFKREPVSL